MRIRLRAGVYFDEQGVERMCAILELVTFDGEVRRLTVVDARTGEPVPNPDEALVVESASQAGL